MTTDSLIGYEIGTYNRKVRCCECDKLIPIGKRVYGKLHGGSLSHRICQLCHDKREDRAIRKLRKINKR